MEFSGITLVTGAAGFMGGHLIERLARLGVRVRATARPRKDTSFFDNLGVEYVGADLTKPETLPPLLRGAWTGCSTSVPCATFPRPMSSSTP